MDSNLLREYDQVVEYLKKEYLSSFLTFGKTRAFHRIVKQMNITDIIRFYRSLNIVSTGLPENFRNRIEQLATDEEKQEPLFRLVINEYPLDYFASNVLQKFPTIDFAKLKKLNDLRIEQVTRGNFTPRVLGGVLAAGALLLRSIPQSVVARVIDYAEYEYFVFMIMVVVIIYLSIILVPVWFKYNEASSHLGPVGDVLTYITIKQGEMNN
jgi:hypothetical protein